MNKYAVYGIAQVTVTKEVWAHDETEAMLKAEDLYCLTEYCGNGGYDKLIGVNGTGESVSTDGNAIEWQDVEFIKGDPDYHECPECGEQLEQDDYGWYCEECNMWFDENGKEVDIDEEEEDYE